MGTRCTRNYIHWQKNVKTVREMRERVDLKLKPEGKKKGLSGSGKGKLEGGETYF
jgi:hypothetical protein